MITAEGLPVSDSKVSLRIYNYKGRRTLLPQERMDAVTDKREDLRLRCIWNCDWSSHYWAG